MGYVCACMWWFRGGFCGLKKAIEVIIYYLYSSVKHCGVWLWFTLPLYYSVSGALICT